MQALEARDEVRQARVATFAAGSAALTAESTAYLDALVDSLRPSQRQLLVLEGHARDAGDAFHGDHGWLAVRRAQVVRDHLVERHGFAADRVDARAWFGELPESGAAARGVDARLVTPAR